MIVFHIVTVLIFNDVMKSIVKQLFWKKRKASGYHMLLVLKARQSPYHIKTG